MSAELEFTDKEKSTLGCMASLVLVPLTWLIVAVAARNAWNGMLAPFFALPLLTLAQAFALRIGVAVFSCAIHVPAKVDREKRDPWWSVRHLAVALITLGWVHIALAVWRA